MTQREKHATENFNSGHANAANINVTYKQLSKLQYKTKLNQICQMWEK